MSNPNNHVSKNPRKSRGGNHGATLLPLLLVFLAGFVAGNLSDPVVQPAWQRWLAKTPEEPREAEKPASPQAQATRMLGKLEASERRLRDLREELLAEAATQQRTLYLMKEQGQAKQTLARKQEEIAQGKKAREQLDTQLAEISQLRQRYQGWLQQPGSDTEEELNQLKLIETRARYWLEILRDSPALDIKVQPQEEPR
jgi:DNA repair exonuclease SbcCD ATPase subunit